MACAAEDVGPIDAQRFMDFIWQVAQRPEGAPADWRRERPLWIVLDNYSVHKSQTVAETRAAWAAAGIELVYLPAYCPELSAIEPIWNDTKQHHLPTRSFSRWRRPRARWRTPWPPRPSASRRPRPKLRMSSAGPLQCRLRRADRTLRARLRGSQGYCRRRRAGRTLRS